MNICVIGTGYVGLVVGVCMADLGFQVVCVDRDRDKISTLQQGGVPIYEPGLDSILSRNIREKRLRFTTDGASAIRDADVVYIAVGTPGLPDGSADLSGVLAVSELIAKNAARPLIVVIKSTVPVGTADQVRSRIAAHIQHDFDVVSNPEFLKEGAAIDDFNRPDRIVLGCQTERARGIMRRLYRGLVISGRPILFMDNRSAELTKYASNAMLATRISFMNELSQLCEVARADIDMVRKGIGTDSRIGRSFLYAGVGYGGSCFPKDVSALITTAQQFDVELKIATAVEDVNQAQKKVLAQKVFQRFGDDLSGKRFAIWGLAFKPETDDMREAPAVVTIEALLAAGASIAAYDPEAKDTAYQILGDRITYGPSMVEVLDGAEALLLVTEWSEFRNPSWDLVRERLNVPVIFDGRNIYDPTLVRQAGLEYFGIGRQ